MVLFTWRPNEKELTTKDYTNYILGAENGRGSSMWKSRVRKASGAHYACQKTLGSTLGLSLVLMRWCYVTQQQSSQFYFTVLWCGETSPIEINVKSNEISCKIDGVR